MIIGNQVKLWNMKGIDILLNFGNGSLVGLEEESITFIEKLKNEEINDYSLMTIEQKELLEFLLENEFVSEHKIVENKFNVTSAYSHLTNKCNLHCVGCYSLDDKRNVAKDLSFEELCLSFDYLKEIGVKNLIFSGGEPLYRKDIVDLTKYAKVNCEFEAVILITNGTINRPKDYKELAKYVDVVAVSVDSYSADCPAFIRDEGIFSKIMKTIEELKKNDIEVSILPTVHHLNADKMEEYLKLANELDVQISFSLLSACDTEELKEFLPNSKDLNIISNCLFETGSSLDDAPVDNSLSAQNYCGAGKSLIAIDTDGTVYPCHMMMAKRYALGNTKEQSIADILTTSRLADEFKYLSVDDIKDCKSCDFKYFCGGGCRARSLMINDDIYQKDPYCQLFFNYYEELTNKVVSASMSK